MYKFKGLFRNLFLNPCAQIAVRDEKNLVIVNIFNNFYSG